MQWKFDSQSPIYMQVMNILRNQILSGMLKPRDKVPSVRELAFYASVNPNTMQKALVELEHQGLIITNGTNGRYVTDDVSIIDSARSQILKDFTEEYIQKISQFGISMDDAVAMIKQHYNEGNKNT